MKILVGIPALSTAAVAFSLVLAACGGGNSSQGGSASSGGNSSSSGGSSSGSSSSSGSAGYNWTALGSALDSYLTTTSPAPSGSVDGYSFLVYNKTGVLYTRAGGNQTVDSVVALASASKMPSAAAIMTLVDSGKLDLDTTVSTYLAGSGVTWPSDKAAITTRMLLAHTSGLPGLADSTNPSCINKETSTTLRACVQSIANTALVSQPGAEFNYGGADYQVAGYIATLLSRQDWQTFFSAAIATPLALSTFTYGSGLLVTNPRIAGGARSDIADYATILQMLQNNGVYNGAQVLSASSVAVLENNAINGLPKAHTPFPSSVAADYPGYGLGLWTESAALYSGSPGPEYSDPGLYGTCPWIDNGLEYGAIVLIDQDVTTGLSMWNAARSQIIKQLAGG
ncbi:serine hydrolase domain-containing protein [Nevskia soli]|uniref:serine hydrolase domain-containing protein n=1 Tax=Nevskia soli TaxID=418856 RepID=UPI0014701B4F|nr:serine hydrolase domain-containing protein [Nevskia soli]